MSIVADGVIRLRRAPRAAWEAAAAGAGVAYLWVVNPTRPGAGRLLPCPFRAITGLDCPVCGATRATWALVHGHPLRALGYNALWTLLVPLVVWAWAIEARGRTGGSRHPFRRRWFWRALVVVAAAFAIARNLPWAPWRGLHS